MKRWTVIAMFAAAALLVGCKKEDKGAPGGSAAGTAAGTAAAKDPAAGTAAAKDPAAGTAAAVAPAKVADVPALEKVAEPGVMPPADPAAADPAAAAAATGPVPSDAEVEAVGQKAVKMMDALSVVVAANATDCAAMAPAVEKVIEQHKDFVAEAKKWNGNAAAEAKMEAWMQKNGTMEATMQKMMPGMMACGEDPKVEAAFKKMDL